MGDCTSASNSSLLSRAASMTPAKLGSGLTRIAAALALFCLLAAHPARQGSPGAQGQHSVMNDLSKQFNLLESRLIAGDTSGYAAAAGANAELDHKLATLRPQVNLVLADEFASHVERLGALVDESVEWASQGRLVETRQAFEDLRATCVSCHLKFRSDNEKRGNYPARGNTLAGNVELRNAEGIACEDRSWVLVFLESEKPQANPPPPRRNPRISQQERRFDPRVLPVPVGSVVDFPNDDTIFHNVFSVSKTAPFDLGVYDPGRSASVRMERTGLVKVYCNIHPEMAASIVVLANPWYTLCDRGGGFVISGVPDGEYVLRAWNDMGAESRRSVKLEAGCVMQVPITLEETRHAVAHTNKFGKPYSGKYR